MLKGLVAIAKRTNLTAAQLADGYSEGWNDVVYDSATRKESIGSWWRDEETAGRIAVERIKEMQMRAVWDKKPIPKANWDHNT
ncbi:hypothetical protein KA005_77735 [bacterium]|nr:hypothetical protein [bacterium]